MVSVAPLHAPHPANHLHVDHFLYLGLLRDSIDSAIQRPIDGRLWSAAAEASNLSVAVDQSDPTAKCLATNGRYQSVNFNQKCRSKHHSNIRLRHCLNHCCTFHLGRRQLEPQPASARRSSLAQIATAAFASSSTLPIKMKPCIWRSKQICVTRLPTLLSACE
jgi:hypothetical protein